MKNILSFIKRRVISRLEKFRDNTIDELTNIPKPMLSCYQCGEHTSIHHHYGAGIGVCYDCYEILDECSYCNTKQISLKNSICSGCMDNSASIMSYSEKPDPYFHRIKRGNVETPPHMTYEGYGHINGKIHHYEHFGVEIETDRHIIREENPRISGNRLASLINLIGRGSTGKENLLYSKNDCTCWLEVVSHPMSWNYWLLYGQEIFYTLFQKLQENRLYGYSASDSGMHIHVTRNAIKSYNLLKMMEFVYNPDNYHFILDISQREDDKLREWGNPYLSEHSRENLLECIADHRMAQGGLERSTAINLHNRNTIEFRIFRGTVNFQSFCKNLEFVRSLIHWTKVTSLKVAKGNEGLKSYLSYLEKNQNEYQNLCFFLSRRGFGSYDLTSERWTREHSSKLDDFSFNSDTKGLEICV